MAITSDQFNDFLREMSLQGGEYKCSFCGNTDFARNVGNSEYEGEKSNAPSEFRLKPGDAGGEYYHPFYSISCKRCGRTDFFHANMVTRFTRKKSKDA
jgi:predicted nucleic-acid-binding Zn-ribbon protein